MNQHSLPNAVSRSATWLVVLAVGCLWSSSGHTQSEDFSDSMGPRLAIGIGFDVWPDVGDLRALAPGDFDSTGFTIELSAHWPRAKPRPRNLMFGIDFGVFTNDSDITHVREDIISRGLYITPSIKLPIGDSDRRRYYFDTGLGYYMVDVAEVETYKFGGYSEDELWENSSFGGYIGATVDFGLRSRERRGGFTMGAKIHWFDLGNVHDEDPFFDIDTLGQNAGTLGGPVYSIQFGYVF
jgi:hypothetical protein